MGISDKHIEIIRKLCESYKVKTLTLIGSAVNDNLTSESDLDFAVDFYESDPFKYSYLYLELKSKLEKLLNRSIDLIEIRAIKNQFFKQELNQTNVLVYGH